MSDVIVNITPPAPIELLYSQGGAVGPQGQTGSVGPVGPTNRLVVGTVTSGTAASATISAQTVANGTATQTLNLVLPQGETGSQGIQGVVGPAGPVNVLSVGSVETTSATTASISITGTAPSQVISFVVPRGPQGIQGEVGPFMSVQVGGVTTGASGTNAKVETVTAGGTVTLNFTIPRGADATANLADETPQPLGIASVGSALKAARADHVHSVPAISFGSLTGVPLTFSPSAHTHAVSDVANLQAALDSKQPAGSYATLVNGAVPSSMLPGFVDDIIEYATLSAFPATNDVGKIYTAIDTRKIYRWSGTGYVEISPSPGTTTDVPEGTNLYHTTARAAAAAPVQSVSGRTGSISITKSDVGLDNVPNTDATARANHTGTQTASTISDFAAEAAKYGPVTSVSGRTGVITLAQLGSSGTASASTFLRGDGQWTAAGGTNIVESATAAGFPATGASSTLYIATDANRVFRFDASGVYVEVGPGAVAAVGGGGAGGTTDPLWSSVRLLLPLDANTYDYRSGQGSTVTAFGSAAIASSSPKFGAGCLFLDGNSDYLQVVDGFNYIVPGTGDFTIEAWARPAFLSAEANYVFEARETQVAGYGVYLNSSSTVVVASSSATSLITGAALSTGQWHHVALCRASGTLRLFINGTVAGTPVANTTNFASNRLLIGRSLSDSTPFWFDGNIDDVRYTSAARYTSNFSVATAAFPTS